MSEEETSFSASYQNGLEMILSVYKGIIEKIWSINRKIRGNTELLTCTEAPSPTTALSDRSQIHLRSCLLLSLMSFGLAASLLVSLPANPTYLL